jgi:hypothetical protein
MTIIFLTSFFIWLLICIEHAKNLVWGQVWMHGFVFAQWFYFFWVISKVFFTMLHIQLGLPHPLALGLLYYICGRPLDLLGIHLLVAGRGQLPMMLCNIILHLLWGMQDSCFTWTNSHSSSTYFLVYASMGRYCGFGEWCLDIGYHCHHWVH